MNNAKPNRYLSGNYAPVHKELNLSNLEVIGTLPRSLKGTYYCIGSNPQFDPIGNYHWFTGDGMVHAITINAQGASYCNRWVRTEKFTAERQLGQPIFDGMDQRINNDPQYNNLSNNSANTNIVMHAGMLQALNEGALPMLLSQNDLNTIGTHNFDGRILETLSAHPRLEAATELMHTYSYLSLQERLRYHCINNNGDVIEQREINWPYPCMMHDFLITENYCIFPCFPMTYSFERAMQSGEFFKWEPHLPTAFGIMPRGDMHAKIIWIEFDSCHVMHFSNAFEHNSDIIIDAFKYKTSPIFHKSSSDEPLLTQLVRWRIDLKSKSVNETGLEDSRSDFPRFDERFNGRRYNICYYAEDSSGKFQFLNRVNRIDFETGDKQYYDFGKDGITEPVFVPDDKNSKKDEGYLIAMRYSENSKTSCLEIFNAQHINDGPVTSIKLPCRVPYTFHGNWVNASGKENE